jgi:hypothetical protein
LPLRQRIALSFLTKFTNTYSNRRLIIADGVVTIVERISKLENGVEPVDYFKPSKTAQNALNFITQKNIEELKQTEDVQIINIFKCLNMICGIYDTDNVVGKFFQHNKEPLSRYV